MIVPGVTSIILSVVLASPSYAVTVYNLSEPPPFLSGLLGAVLLAISALLLKRGIPLISRAKAFGLAILTSSALARSIRGWVFPDIVTVDCFRA